MEAGFSQAQAQRVLKQRNMLVLASAGLGIITIFSLIAASERDREIVLQPVLTRQIEISSGGVSREYLELVTRDASVMMQRALRFDTPDPLLARHARAIATALSRQLASR